MRTFEITLPATPGVIDIEGVEIDLTDDDAHDLNEGASITTLTTQGEEVACYPEGRS